MSRCWHDEVVELLRPGPGQALPRRHPGRRRPLRALPRGGSARDRHGQGPARAGRGHAPGSPATARPSAPCAATSATPRSVLAALGLDGVDGALVDLGVSSPAARRAGARLLLLARPARSTCAWGRRAQTLADLLARVDERELARILKEYGEEPFARPIARAIKRAVEDGRSRSTPPGSPRSWPRRHPAQGLAAGASTRPPAPSRRCASPSTTSWARWPPGSTACPAARRRAGAPRAIAFHRLEDRMVKEELPRPHHGLHLPARPAGVRLRRQGRLRRR